MRRKALLPIVLLAAVFAVNSNAQQALTDAILKNYSARMYSTDPVSDSDIDIIVKAGLRAPSASNLQPWFLTIVKDKALLKQMMPNITDNNILIAISGKEGNWVQHDCGIAAGYMCIAAQALGLGARIYANPVRAINAAHKESLGLPEGFSVITVLRVGHVDKNVDAVSAASPRKKMEEVVVFK